MIHTVLVRETMENDVCRWEPTPSKQAANCGFYSTICQPQFFGYSGVREEHLLLIRQRIID